MVSATPTFANWWSKLLFARRYERQFFIPVPGPKLEKALLKLMERVRYGGDFAHIPINRPVFIIGPPRSGTSLLNNLLCAHEQAAYFTVAMNCFPSAICSIEWVRKTFRFNVGGDRFLQDSIYADFGSPSEPIMLWMKWMLNARRSADLPIARAADLASGKPEEIRRDVRKILHTFGGGGRRFICKYPAFQTELRLLQDLFPDAMFVHIVRDGRRVAHSMLKLYRLTNAQLEKIHHPWMQHLVPYPQVPNLQRYLDEFGADDIRTTANVWQDSIDLIRETRVDLKHYCELRYEDLLTDPRETLAALLKFLGMPWPAAGNASFATEFASIGALRHEARYEGFEDVERIASRTLKEFRYA